MKRLEYLVFVLAPLATLPLWLLFWLLGRTLNPGQDEHLIMLRWMMQLALGIYLPFMALTLWLYACARRRGDQPSGMLLHAGMIWGVVLAALGIFMTQVGFTSSTGGLMLLAGLALGWAVGFTLMKGTQAARA